MKHNKSENLQNITRNSQSVKKDPKSKSNTKI
jgi:hypothetical protein